MQAAAAAAAVGREGTKSRQFDLWRPSAKPSLLIPLIAGLHMPTATAAWQRV